MVLAEVGEAGRDQPHAVQPPLVDPVRRGLQRQVRDTASGEVGEQRRDIGGIWRGQSGRGDLLLARADAESAHAGGVATQALEDLAAEHRHRGLSVGAGDSDADAGLDRIERPRGQGVGAAQVAGVRHGHGQALDVIRR